MSYLFHVPASPDVIPQEDEVFVFPTSFAQHRMWFIDQFAAGIPLYNIPIAVRIDGVIDCETLAKSLNQIVCRHEILRTTFIPIDGQPMQLISASHVLAIEEIELRTIPAPERAAGFLHHVAERLRQPFDLTRLPLLRVSLFHMTETESILLLVAHHIITDTWSIGVLLQEATTLYQGYLAGEPIVLPELEIQYADFAVWQREWLQELAVEAQLAYWQQQMSNELPILSLPLDRPRPPIQTYRGARHLITVPHELVEDLKVLGQSEGATLYMTLLAVFKLLLLRYSGQHDLLVGVPIANRNQLEIEPLIGFFVNTLVMRTDLSGNPSFRELLRRVKETAIGAYSHQDVPFEVLVDSLQPERTLSHAPLFQVMFELDNAPLPTLTLPGLNLTPLQLDNGTAEFDLALSLLSMEEGLRGTIEYNSDLFDSATIERLGEHFLLLLAGIRQNPERSIADYPLLTTEEKDMLRSWNATTTHFPQDMCLHQLVEHQASGRSEACAVRFDGATLSYGDLNRQANQLAHRLRTLGVGAETMVGLFLERSFDMAVALLAVLKAGGAFVPLDPDYPMERLSFILQDSHPAVLITQSHLMARLPDHDGRQIILDRDWEEIKREPTDNPSTPLHPQHLAYVMYTSGSTGRPKGVQITHHSLVAYTYAIIKAFGLTKDDRILQFASLSFDVAVEEFLPTWACGATVVLRPSGMLAYDELLHLTEREQLTAFELPTAYWHEWVKAINANQAQLPASLRFVIIGGERVLPERLAVWARFNVPLVHVYGLTEVSITSTVYRWDKQHEIPDDLPIGQPIANTRVYVLDRHMRPVPIGIPGELYIGGEGLARGYTHQPALTAERFLPDPFSLEPGARIYRTGDRARLMADGNIRFLSRVDQQVKIRGYRVEPGEIESVLGEHPDVHEAIVAARTDRTGNQQLVAFVVPQPSRAITCEALREYLRDHVPDYMVPAELILLQSLPVTPNGKIDVRALLNLDVDSVVLQRAEPPRNELEHTLSQIWCEALQRSDIGRNDNFFDLGGHSLLMAQVHSKLRKVLSRDIPIIELFKYPTIASFAHYLSREAPTNQLALPASTERAAARREPRTTQAQRRQAHRMSQQEQGEDS
jgi:amino acid adenylation domain-containing protein